MKYLSVCSGIEAASKAWESIGWKPVAFSEIEPFPSAVLKHHWPEVPNLGDMSKYEQWNIQSGSVDLLVGGTPCQSFSVAGLRQGLKDPRGNLMLTYLAIAERLKPRWLVWENVPGVLSSNGGKDFGCFLGALGELGYVDWAYRVLDAQWFGVAQRRRRVFVVAHLGEGSLAAKVLFESESVRRDTPPSREAGQGVATNVAPSLTASNDPSRSPQSSEVTQQVNAVLEASVVSPTITQCKGSRGGCSDEALMEIRAVHEALAETLMASDYKGPGHNRDHNFITEPVIIDRAAFNQGQNAQYKPRIEHGETMDSLVARGPHAVLFENHPNDSRVTGPHDVAPSCVSRYGTGGGNVPLVQEAIAFPATMSGTQCAKTKNLSPAICSVNQTAIAFEPGIATREGSESRFVKELSPTLRKEMGDNQVAVSDSRMAVRRLTPRECERLQGFNDDHTMISWRNKPADQCPDGPRYKALGNSMAVPCMAWIGKRIDAVEKTK
jgi:DNA (cytosine-5)-methyltransferase 1